MKKPPKPPDSYYVGQELNWEAPWVDVSLRVELPFWLMMANATILTEVEGHTFPIHVTGETFELFGGEVRDSKFTSIYQGPLKERDELSKGIQDVLRARPELNILWRKCKTVLRIDSRCNGDVWSRLTNSGEAGELSSHAGEKLYAEELCRAHIPVINRLIRSYRLASYDYFAFEVAPWDVPVWYIMRGNEMVRCLLVPYRGWDHRPLITRGENTMFYELVDGARVQEHLLIVETPGELELLDAVNLMERGDYSGAVRRVTTAIEVVVEAVVGKEIERAEGNAVATNFLNATRMNFKRRIDKYQSLTGRTLLQGLSATLDETRKLRHRIVHGGYRISAGERGRAQRAVDTGRWIFNWFENDAQRSKTREKQIGLRSLGRDLTYGVFRSKITAEGVTVSRPEIPR